MSIVPLIFKQKMVLDILISRMQGKIAIFRTTLFINVLYYGTLTQSTLDQYGLDLSKNGTFTMLRH